MRYLSIILLALVADLMSCDTATRYQKTEGLIWNTMYHVSYKGPAELKDSIVPVLDEVAASLSVFDENSLVSKLNRGMEIEADSHFQKVYEASVRIHGLSGGNFDPTLSPLIDAWGFGRGHHITGDTMKIDSVLQFVGIGKTRMENGRIIKDDIRTRFNLSAIAKGYGCDEVGEMLERNGVKDYMVEIGGEVALKGDSPSGGIWKIGIDTPAEYMAPGESTVLILGLTDCGIATSGNYRNYFENDAGEKMGHTISPVTGRPFQSEILSATIIAPACMEADGLATACMASTFHQAREIIRHSGTEGMLILADTIWMSPGFSLYITSEASEPGRKDRN